jgi:hypothetical protein
MLIEDPNTPSNCIYGMCVTKGKIFSGGLGGWVHVWDIESG